jgi:hypothetical protein
MRTHPLLLAALLLPVPAAAATPQAILQAARDATGGPAWDHITALHIVATQKTGGGPARLERWEDVATGRYREQRVLAPLTTGEAFDGISSWVTSRSGIAYRLGDPDARLVAADESYRVARAWWFPDRHQAAISAAGTTEEAGRHFDVLSISPEAGRPFTLWIDQATHLIDRTIEQQAEDLVVTKFSDYRPINGLRLPYTIRQGDGGDPSFDTIETVEQIDINPKIPDASFSIPPLPASDIELPSGAASAEIPFRLEANRILVPLSIDGHSGFEAEFDSGGSLILPPALLQTLGLNTAGRFKAQGGGEGFVVSKIGTAKTINIGPAILHDRAFKSFAFSNEERTRALVGIEVLQRFAVSFDFDRLIMTLTKPDAFQYHGKGAVIPFHFQDNQPEITGTVDGIAGLFAIDTGDAGSLLLIAPFARRYGLVERYHATLPYGGRSVAATHGVRTRVGTVTFDGPDGRPIETVSRPVTRISLQQSGFDADLNVSGNIGLGILKQFNLTFDYRRQQIILERNHQYGQPDIYDRAGFRAEATPSGWHVVQVYPNSPAAEAGLREGDLIATIDGQAHLSPADLFAKTHAPVGTHLMLSVQRDQHAVQLIVTLRDII